MGFEGRKVLKLSFDDPDLAGLEVICRRPTIGQVLNIGKIVDGNDDPEVGMRATAEVLCQTLIGWNLENDGQPVPKTAAALLAQDQPISQAIIGAWEQHAIKVSPGKESSSSDGGESVAASIPMEPLSESQAS